MEVEAEVEVPFAPEFSRNFTDDIVRVEDELRTHGRKRTELGGD